MFSLEECSTLQREVQLKRQKPAKIITPGKGVWSQKVDVTPESDSVCIFRLKDFLRWLLPTSRTSLLVGQRLKGLLLIEENTSLKEKGNGTIFF